MAGGDSNIIYADQLSDKSSFNDFLDDLNTVRKSTQHIL